MDYSQSDKWLKAVLILVFFIMQIFHPFDYAKKPKNRWMVIYFRIRTKVNFSVDRFLVRHMFFFEYMFSVFSHVFESFGCSFWNYQEDKYAKERASEQL